MVARDDLDIEARSEAEAKEGLRNGIQRSRAIISYYRRRLIILRDVAERRATDRPLFNFDKGRRPANAGRDPENSG
jgi:hypothetical protein